MRRVFVQLFLIALLFLPKVSLAAATAVPPIASFDLFGFPLSAADLGLGKRAASLGQALQATFPKVFKAQDFPENNYSGYCFGSGSDQYRLSWKDSETEGFSFAVERLKNQKLCSSPFGEGIAFKSGSLNPSQFFPISHSHPGLQLGVSTLAQVQKELGRPDYSSSDKLVYVLKRDKLKEKGCEMKANKGELAAVEVELGFSNGVLQSVILLNSIAGEC